MATLKPSLTITSSDATSDTGFTFTVTDSLTTTEPSVGLSRVSVATGAATQIFADNSANGTVYVYLKNTDSTNFVSLMNDAGQAFGRLNADEFAFIPINTNEGLEVQADTGACVVEYAYWSKS